MYGKPIHWHHLRKSYICQRAGYHSIPSLLHLKSPWLTLRGHGQARDSGSQGRPGRAPKDSSMSEEFWGSPVSPQVHKNHDGLVRSRWQQACQGILTKGFSDIWDHFYFVNTYRGLTAHRFETPPTSVLDLGCGGGYWALEAAKQWPVRYHVFQK